MHAQVLFRWLSGLRLVVLLLDGASTEDEQHVHGERASKQGLMLTCSSLGTKHAPRWKGFRARVPGLEVQDDLLKTEHF